MTLVQNEILWKIIPNFFFKKICRLRTSQKKKKTYVKFAKSFAKARILKWTRPHPFLGCATCLNLKSFRASGFLAILGFGFEDFSEASMFLSSANKGLVCEHGGHVLDERP